MMFWKALGFFAVLFLASASQAVVRLDTVAPDHIWGRSLSPLTLTSTGSANNICTLVAQDAWNFNDFTQNIGAHWFYPHVGTLSGSAMGCGYNGEFIAPVCPIDAPGGGPGGTGSAYIFSDDGGDWDPVGLKSNHRGWQDYSIADELSITFHFKARRNFAATRYGWFRSPVVEKAGDFYSGSDNSTNHAERICMNVDIATDTFGPSIYAEDCGDGGTGTNDGTAETTGVDSTPFNVWIHVGMVFNNTTCKIYVDGSEVYTGSCTGGISNAGAMWTIGEGENQFTLTDYEIDNLQIFDFALTPSQVAAADCDVPD